jgi:fluoride ion exporter CrcB/FEX
VRGKISGTREALIEEGSWLQAGANVALTTGLCLGVCALGLMLGRLLVGGR